LYHVLLDDIFGRKNFIGLTFWILPIIVRSSQTTQAYFL